MKSELIKTDEDIETDDLDINNINATDQNGKYYNINVTGIYLK